METNLFTEINDLWRKNRAFKEKQRAWMEQIHKTRLQAGKAKQYFHQWAIPYLQMLNI